MVPASQKLHILCASKASGKETKAVCEVGCIGCKLCAKQDTRIKVEDNLAFVDLSEVKPFEAPTAALACPQKTIIDYSFGSSEEWLIKARDSFEEKQNAWKEEEKAKKAAEKKAKEAAAAAAKSETEKKPEAEAKPPVEEKKD